MLKTLTAGLMAATLTLTSVTPAQANGLSQEDVGKLVFGLLATAAIANAVKNDRNDQQPRTERRQTKPTVVFPERRHPRQENNPAHRHDRRTTLPRACLNNVEGRFGTQRMLGRRCLMRSFPYAETLPSRCEVRVFTNRGPRNGFDPQCLRQQGFRISSR